MKNTVKLLAATTMLFAFCQDLAADTELYRWKDTNGRLVHSDRPPPAGVEYETLNVRVGKTESRGPQTDAPRVSNAPDPGQSGKRTELEVTSKNPEICKNAQNNVQVLRSAARIRIKADDGNYTFLSEDQKNEQIQKAEDLIKRHCE